MLPCVYRYTSLGSTLDTVPNPALKPATSPLAEGKLEEVVSDRTHSTNAKGAYLPAYMLTDDTQERAGRNWHD